MKIDLILVSTESGHGKDPMDEVIRCTEDLIKHLPASNIVITKYGKENVDHYASLIAKNLAIPCNEFGISKVHEIWDVLRDLLLFLQFQKREKHPWKSVFLTYYFYLQFY